MKKVVGLSGVITLSVLLAFSLMACSNPAGSGDTPLTGEVTIPAFIKVGVNVMADTSLLAGSGDLRYLWKKSTALDGSYENIAGAIASIYKPVPADEGCFLRAEVVRSGYSGSVSSAAIRVQGAAAFRQPGNPMELIMALYQYDDSSTGIIAMKPDGTGKKWLYRGTNTIWPEQPFMGPDGKTVLFCSDNNGGIYAWNLESQTMNMHAAGWDYSYPVYSGDMSTVYAQYDNNDQFVAIDAVSGEITSLSHWNEVHYPSLLSENKIVYQDNGLHGNIGILTVDGENSTLEIIKEERDNFTCQQPLAIPALNRIIYVRGDNNYSPPLYSIHIMNSDGTGDLELMEPAEYELDSPSINNAGNRICWFQCNEDSSNNIGKIMTASFDGTALSGITEIYDIFSNLDPAWQPLFCRIDGSIYNSLEDFSPPARNLGWYHNSSGYDYTVRNAEELAALALLVSFGADNFGGKKVILNNDIDLTGVNWIPIGSNRSFRGTFDGNNKNISNLTSTSGNYYYNGFFGQIGDDGRVENLTISNAVLGNAGYGYAGAVAAYNFYGTVENCHVSGEISNGDVCGGIVGGIFSGTVQNCSYTGTGNAVSGTSSAGGIAGSMDFATIQNCFASGTITGNYYAGGIIGYPYGSGSTGQILNCYAACDVASNGNAGGIGGNIAYVTIQYCYARGTVSSSNDAGGGIAARNNNSNVLNCVALVSNVSGSSANRIVGTTFGSITNNNNFASGTMTINGAAFGGTSGVSTLNGETVSDGAANDQYNSQDWWSTAVPNGPGFDFSESGSWDWDPVSELPVLK